MVRYAGRDWSKRTTLQKRPCGADWSRQEVDPSRREECSCFWKSFFAPGPVHGIISCVGHVSSVYQCGRRARQSTKAIDGSLKGLQWAQRNLWLTNEFLLRAFLSADASAAAAQEITSRGLDQFYNTEEDCLVKKADLPTILKLLQVSSRHFHLRLDLHALHAVKLPVIQFPAQIRCTKMVMVGHKNCGLSAQSTRTLSPCSADVWLESTYHCE